METQVRKTVTVNAGNVCVEPPGLALREAQADREALGEIPAPAVFWGLSQCEFSARREFPKKLARPTSSVGGLLRSLAGNMFQRISSLLFAQRQSPAGLAFPSHRVWLAASSSRPDPNFAATFDARQYWVAELRRSLPLSDGCLAFKA